MDQNIKYMHQNMIKIIIASSYFFAPNGPKFPRPHPSAAEYSKITPFSNRDYS